MDPELPQKAAEVAATAADAGWFKMLHVLGALVFLGGSFSAARLLGLLIKAEATVRTSAAAMARKVYITLTLPAGVLLVGTGIYTLVTDPGQVGYMKQGWFHMKLTIVTLILMVDHLLVMRPLKALARGGADPRASEGLYRAGFWMLGLLSFALCLALFVIRK
jgi:uncharacterized membrane protein